MTDQLDVSGPLALYRYAVAGKPKDSYPILVLGHALGVDHTMWDRVLPLLPSGLEVVLWDQPGHGQSALLDLPSSPEQSQPASVLDTARALHRGLVELGVIVDGAPRPVVAGLSLGGMVSLAFAQKYSSDLAALSMLSSGAVLLPHEAWFERAEKVSSDGQGFLADSTMERWFSEGFRQGTGSEAVAETQRIFLSTNPEGYAQCCELIAGTDLRAETASVQVPTLLVVGENDPGMTPEQGKELSLALPNSSLEVVVGAKHMTAVEQPQLVADLLTRLVSDTNQ